MPTYDYVCAKCGHQFEKFQPKSAAVLRRCPSCGKLALKRLIGGGAGLIFKGTGFYATDYKKSSAPAGGSAPPATPATPAPAAGADAPKTPPPAAPPSKPAS